MTNERNAPVLHNAYNGYAEVYYRNHQGVVEKQKFVKYTDFEKDVIHEVQRWVATVYEREGSLFNWPVVGKKTGYATRKEAVQAIVEHVDGRIDGNREA